MRRQLRLHKSYVVTNSDLPTTWRVIVGSTRADGKMKKNDAEAKNLPLRIIFEETFFKGSIKEIRQNQSQFRFQ